MRASLRDTRTLMWKHGVSSVTAQNDLALHVTPVGQQLSIVELPLADLGAHRVHDLLHVFRPTLVLLLQVLPRRGALPALLEPAQLALWLGNKPNNIKQAVLRDGKHQEVLVGRQPRHGQRRIRPRRGELGAGKGKGATVRDAARVSRPVHGELVPKRAMDAVAGDDEVSRGRRPVLEGDGDCRATVLEAHCSSVGLEFRRAPLADLTVEHLEELGPVHPQLADAVVEPVRASG